MEWLLIGGSVLLGWVCLVVVAGERLRRDQERQVKSMLEQAPPPASPPRQHEKKAA